MDRSDDLTTMLRNGLIGRREFLKRAIGLGLSLPAAGALLAACGGGDDDGGEAAPPAEPAEPAPPADTGAAPAAPAPSGVDLEGITIKYAKAPHGEDEAELTEQWLQPFKDATGPRSSTRSSRGISSRRCTPRTSRATTLFDVMYQVSTHLTLFGEQGNFEDMTS